MTRRRGYPEFCDGYIMILARCLYGVARPDPWGSVGRPISGNDPGCRGIPSANGEIDLGDGVRRHLGGEQYFAHLGLAAYMFIGLVVQALYAPPDAFDVYQI